MPNYEKIIYSELFEGIDLMYSGNNRGWKYYYIIKPGADPENIEFAFSGADSIYINVSGDLVLATTLGAIVFPQGDAYQINSSGNKIPLAWQPGFELDGTTVNFSTGSYDTSKPLVFEVKQGNATTSYPSIENLEWSTYYGEGTYYNGFYAVETNVSENIWIVGSTSNEFFPVANGSNFTYFGNFDAVLLNFTYEGERNWAIFYGGSGNEYIDERRVKKAGLTVDNLGNSYIAGGTSSPVIPLFTPPGAYLDSVNAGREIFIAKFNTDGELRWSTYFGDDFCTCGCITASYDLKLDNINNLYVTGIVGGTPQVSAYTYITYRDAFIAEFNPAHELIWSTNYGGTWIDIIRDIAFDSNNDLFLTGETFSDDFPVSDPGNGYFYQSTLKDTSDAFIAKISETHIPGWAMYLGGDKVDMATGISIDNDDNIYLCGVTYSKYFPVYDMGTPAYYEDLPQGTSVDTFDYNGDGFLAKFTNVGERLHNTYYGGLSGDGFSDIEVDGYGNVYVTGTSGSSLLPFADPALPNFYVDSTKLDAQDGIILSFNSDLKLQWTTYFGGYEINPGNINRDWVTGLTISNDNLNLFVVGETNSSSDFPWVQLSNAYFDTVPSFFEGFISRFNIGGVINIESIPALNNNILVYPNPATTALYIHSDKEIDSYHIYNITGQLILSGKYSGAIPIAKLS